MDTFQSPAKRIRLRYSPVSRELYTSIGYQGYISPIDSTAISACILTKQNTTVIGQ